MSYVAPISLTQCCDFEKAIHVVLSECKHGRLDALTVLHIAIGIDKREFNRLQEIDYLTRATGVVCDDVSLRTRA
jgi:hypothetical protein